MTIDKLEYILAISAHFILVSLIAVMLGHAMWGEPAPFERYFRKKG